MEKSPALGKLRHRQWKPSFFGDILFTGFPELSCKIYAMRFCFAAAVA
jgi:hypothetical protein